MNGTRPAKRSPADDRQGLIPDSLRDLRVVVAGAFTSEGLLFDANRGLLDLLDDAPAPVGAVDVRELFINPRFDQIAARRGTGPEDEVYKGVLNLGGGDAGARSLRGRIRRRNHHLVMIAEYDLQVLEEANVKLLTMNHDLAKALRASGRAGDIAPVPEATMREAAPRPRLHAPKARLFRQGEHCEHVFRIVQGWVVLSHLLEDGRRQVLDFAVPGDLIGLMGWLQQPMEYTAECVTAVQAAAIPRADVDARIRSRGCDCNELLFSLCKQAARAQDHLINTARCTARERTAHLLLELFNRTRGGPPANDGERIRFPLSQTVIADALGLRGETVSRALKGLREDRIVELHSGKLTVLDAARFADFEHAGGDALE